MASIMSTVTSCQTRMTAWRAENPARQQTTVQKALPINKLPYVTFRLISSIDLLTQKICGTLTLTIQDHSKSNLTVQLKFPIQYMISY